MSAPDRRVIIYPSYLDSTKTVAEGRAIPKEQACITPFVQEMLESCKQLKIPAEIENKHYPRAWWVPGRLRVQLKNADGTPTVPEIPNKRTLMIKIAELVAKHPGRKNGVPPVPKEVIEHGFDPAGLPGAKPVSAGASGSGAGTSSAASTSNKKKSSKKK
uniref:Signal recognition particle 19 kDa protein n=1 Tax=Chlamydomonas leiostraca TaxID=1034604 RepID=A0A7S0RQN6_9CHLO|eukprot:CAMPEP_0202861224 /NCGR_PEP_ID=MMETSP1391-20130828/2694_1 /ASSEMBLY_ACC=CAM_ASM_000867 /TAXON_ID=1034604 /ORGANISM="Chlamydomonas leiostraca, Strain SAG 11-49" /LENGTH=159 /DNA_ID=CAMNT_0049540575 /DNA_START=32 /DNA_END=511 /DNA_ORIENTATION=-